MSASAREERARKNRRYLPHEDSYVPREDYYRRWQVDPECVNADFREVGRMEDLIVRTAVYRLIALREATVVGERDWLPDPRLVNPELRTMTTRNAMDYLDDADADLALWELQPADRRLRSARSPRRLGIRTYRLLCTPRSRGRRL